MWLNVGVTRTRPRGDPADYDLHAWCDGAASVSARLVREGVAPQVASGYFRCARPGVPAASHGSGAVESFFDLASLTKPMTALAFEAAGLDRGAPLEAFLPELRGSRTAGVPLELLFAHRAGLPAHLRLYEDLEAGRADEAAALFTASNARTEAPPEHGREGHAPVYSDLGYILAGAALARAVGARDAGEAIGELIAKPLGLSASLGTARALRVAGVAFDARAVPTEVVAERGGEVRGAVHDENAWALTRDGGSGHAGMFGTLGAVLTFARAALGACLRGVAADPLGLAGRSAWMVAPRPGGALRAGFDGKSGAGSSVGRLLGPRTFGHLGFTGTSFWTDPDARVGVALLTNRVHPTRDNSAIRAARPEAHDALAALAMERSAG